MKLFCVVLDRCFWNYFSRLVYYLCLLVFISIWFLYPLEPVKLHIYYLHGYKPFFCIIEAINNVSDMPWCSNVT